MLFQSVLDTGISPYRFYLADYLARRFPRKGKNETDLLRWFLLHMAEQAGSGHLRTDVSTIEREMNQWYGEIGEENGFPETLAGESSKIIADGLASGLIGRLAGMESTANSLPPPRPPLVLTHDSCYIYFLKRRRAEDELLRLLGRRLSADSGSGPSSADAVARLVHAVEFGQKLILLAGGPGTGKTTTVARVLERLFANRASTLPPLKVVPTAPTGRAAARLTEGLAGRGIDLTGQTLHRLLGIIPGRTPRYDENNLLDVDLVVVDEASMVDLNLMNTLLRAMPERSALLLVGDPDQLPSVEAGTLLGDLLAGESESAAGSGGPLDGAVIRLTQTHRSNSAILRAADAVINGSYEAFAAAFESEDVCRHPAAWPDDVVRVIAADHAPTVMAARSSKQAVDTLSHALNARTALTPLRKGAWGAPAMNAQISQLLGGTTEPFAGMPIVITKNDAGRNLWNGDRGLLLSVDNRLRAVFPAVDGPRVHPLAVLPGWEPAWIQTIHKSQGSEFDEVSIVLPQGAGRLLTREILYTALTRARHRVNLYADTEAIREALSRRVVRHSRVCQWAGGQTAG